MAAQALIHGGDGRLFQTEEAPGPDNVNWSALWCSPRTRTQRLIWGAIMYTILMLFPMGGLVGGLTYVRILGTLLVFWVAVAAF